MKDVEFTPEEIQEIYQKLKQYDDPLTDLIEAYGTLQQMRGAAMIESERLNRDVNNVLVIRIGCNPLYLTQKERFKPIEKSLETLNLMK